MHIVVYANVSIILETQNKLHLSFAYLMFTHYQSIKY